MKFSNKTDIQASLNATFAGLADFAAFERQALRAGADVARLDAQSRPGPGMIWSVKVEFRGKIQKIVIELVDYLPPEQLSFRIENDGFHADLRVDLAPLNARETRMTVTADVKPQTLSARLILQSARLAKGSINRKFGKRLDKFGDDLVNRIRQS